MSARTALGRLYALGLLPRDAPDGTARKVIAREHPTGGAAWRQQLLDAHRLERHEHLTGGPF